MEQIIRHIAEQINLEIKSFKPVSGGDISTAYLLETQSQKFLLKVNSKSSAKTMFDAEQQGLRAIESTKTIAVPHVHLVDELDGKAFLLMDFVLMAAQNVKYALNFLLK